ncbi:hypothetical protein CYMTET_15614, partial [Cymbomonas tetramitiformis]
VISDRGFLQAKPCRCNEQFVSLGMSSMLVVDRKVFQRVIHEAPEVLLSTQPHQPDHPYRKRNTRSSTEDSCPASPLSSSERRTGHGLLEELSKGPRKLFGRLAPSSGMANKWTSVGRDLNNSSPTPGRKHKEHNAGSRRSCKVAVLKLDDFELKDRLGEGMTAMVFRGVYLPTATNVAVKVMRKSKIVLMREDHHVYAERKCHIRMCDPGCPFIINFKGTFQDPWAVYMITELAAGDFFTFFHEQNGKLSDRDLNIYLAQVIDEPVSLCLKSRV